MTIPRRLAIFDVAAIGAVSLLYVALEAFEVRKLWSFLAVGIALALFAAYLARRRTDSWRDLGFRADNLVEGLIPFGLFTAVGAAAILVWSHVEGRSVEIGRSGLLLAVYPAWALVQQLVFQGVLHRRLMVLVRRPIIEVVATATCFAAVHVGSLVLVLLTFVAGLAWSFLFRRTPNLWLTAASHAILAALAYPLVLGEDPLSRV